MNGRHWTEDEFLDRMYEAGGGDPAHLDSCHTCHTRWQQLQERRAAITADPEVPHEFLAAQRRAIYSRLENPPRRRSTWAPAFAAALVLIIGLVLFQPVRDPVVPLESTAQDEAVFAELYALEQTSEPLAAQPIEALFENN